jgi:Zn-dependent protease with chaperone function
MDFFAHQEKARRKTVILVFLYLVAVIFIAGFFNLIFFIFHGVDANAFIILTTITLAIIIIATLIRYRALRGGGIRVAELLGAREIDWHTQQPAERTLRNVTEEMAIAAGIPMPTLYVLDRERGINAFVAGYHPRESIMVITHGALQHLSRDELQAVVAHEFSHIFNGDMRLNLYLMSILAGITVFGAYGIYVMDSAGKNALNQKELPPEARHGFHIFPFLVGAVLAAIGYIGVLCARVIKSAISRQREFLADAAAVQFTRDRNGMAGALYKIQTYPRGTWLMNRYAEEISHFCFVPSLRDVFLGGAWLATHPPVEQRIQALDKHFFIRLRSAERRGESPPKQAPLNDAVIAVPIVDPAFASLGMTALLLDSVGKPTPENLRYARSIQKDLPLPVFDAVHQRESVREVIYALLLGKNSLTLQKGGQRLAQREGRATALRANELRKHLQPQLQRLRLPVLDLAIPSLKKLTSEERDTFLHICRELIEADGKLDIFEFCLQVILNKHLNPATQMPHVRYSERNLNALKTELAILIALLAQTSANYPEEVEQLYQRHLRILMPDPPPRPQPSLHAWEHALAKLNQLPPLSKKQLLHVCADCILADNLVKPTEMEILRVVAESLDCPMPPLPHPPSA